MFELKCIELDARLYRFAPGVLLGDWFGDFVCIFASRLCFCLIYCSVGCYAVGFLAGLGEGCLYVFFVSGCIWWVLLCCGSVVCLFLFWSFVWGFFFALWCFVFCSLGVFCRFVLGCVRFFAGDICFFLCFGAACLCTCFVVFLLCWISGRWGIVYAAL